MHYSTGNDQVACGRNSPNVTASAHTDQVTCKTCLRSAAYTASATTGNVEITSAPIVPAKPVIEQSITYRTRNVAFDEWHTNLADGSRLPRGRHFKALQRKVLL
jgi:hypothetical protein